MKRGLFVLLAVPLLALTLLALTLLGNQDQGSKEEVKTIVRGRGYSPPTPAKRAALHAGCRANHGDRLKRLAKFQSLPASFDCRAKGWVHAVGDQGQCGSCYLYSTIYGTLTSAFIRAGYGKNDGSLIMAVQYGMDCHDFGGCNGGWGAEVIDWACKNGWYAEVWTDVNGAVKKDYPPYSARSSSCRKVSGAKLWTGMTWGVCTSDQSDRQPTTDEIKTALYNYGPLNVSLDAGGQFMNGVGTITALGTSIDHEIECVAWDDSKDGGCFLLKNQWSEEWGDKGYRWVTYKAARNCVDWFWVSAQPLPPPPDPPTPPTPPGPGPTPGAISITVKGDIPAGEYYIVPKAALDRPLRELIGPMTP